MVECAAFPRPSAAGKELVARCELVCEVRNALAKAEFGKAASWKPLVTAIEAGQRKLPPDQCAQIEELGAAKAEVDDARLYTELITRAELARGRSTKPAGATAWDHTKINFERLEAARHEMLAFPKVGDAGKALAVEAAHSAAVRTALKASHWGSATTWANLAKTIDQIPPEHADLDEVA
jgi:hypothetical protein